MLKRIVLAVVVAVLTLEATLQLAAVLLPGLSRRGGEPSPDSRLTILCVGDSHTYGAPLTEPQSYPSQLERSLRTRFGDSVDVVNLGVPGMNSAMLANRIEGQIAHFDPDLVIAWTGANSLWNPTESETSGERASGGLYAAAFRSKLFRLGALAWYRATSPTYARPELAEWSEDRTVFRYGDEELVVSVSGAPVGSFAEVRRGIEQDLIRVVEVTQRYEVPLILLTYPYDEILAVRTVNDAARSVALVHEVPLVDTQRSIERALADGFTRKQLVVNAAGPHPRELLYRYIVENLLPPVLELAVTPDDCESD